MNPLQKRALKRILDKTGDYDEIMKVFENMELKE